MLSCLCLTAELCLQLFLEQNEDEAEKMAEKEEKQKEIEKSTIKASAVWVQPDSGDDRLFLIKLFNIQGCNTWLILYVHTGEEQNEQGREGQGKEGEGKDFQPNSYGWRQDGQERQALEVGTTICIMWM
jgi:hypothetical protein